MLLEKFETLIDTPEAVEELRKLILDAAMRGKLVPQDPNDEPASVLLKKIKQQKEQMIKEKRVRREKSFPPIQENEIPYQIPKIWEWVRLKDICYNHGQKTPDSPFVYIDVGSIDNETGSINVKELETILPEQAPSRARKIVKKGTVIYSTVRPYLKNVAIIDRNDYGKDLIASTAFAVLHPFEGISSRFLFYYLRSDIFLEYVN